VSKPASKSFEDNEKTTTDDEQWGEEASTTVEQGEAEKLRSLIPELPKQGGTGISTTGANALEEPTVDDQHADPALVITPPPREAPGMARLIATQGNDSGQELAVLVGKNYTVGRGLDNDFVLTDIAVSRKHFDLRNDDGAWVIVDRGSGNGTVVNGNLEDNPFMLANGDLIEIGNTVFRFEQANGPARAKDAFGVDDEEMSTVAEGKAMSSAADAATPIEAPLPNLAARETMRPKTLPPPAPLRPPPMGSSPVMQVSPSMLVMSPSPASGAHLPLTPTGAGMPGMMPTTIPGQGLMGPSPMVSGYPQATEIPPHSIHAQMLKIAANAARTDPSTALVSPSPYVPYPALAAPPPRAARSPRTPRLVAPSLSKRTKVVLGASAAGVLAAVIVVAVLESSSSSVPSADLSPAPGSSVATTGSAAPSPAPDVTTLPTAPPSPPTTAPVATTNTPAPPAPPIKSAPPPPAVATAVTPPAPVTRTERKQPDPPKAPDNKRPKRTTSSQTASAAPTPTPATPTPPAPKRVAAVDTSDLRRQADAAYAAKRFNEASNLLANAAKNVPDDEAQQLRHRADLVASFGRYYSAGTAPAASSLEQFEKLRQAENYDSSLGSVFNGDIDNRLQQVSPKAAVSYMAKGLYPQALAAIEKAESLGSSDGNIKIVRSALDGKASDLYNDAKAQADSNSGAAKDKLRKMLSMIDSKSTYYLRGKQLLAKLGN
jgi:hypothetical protein